VKDFMRRLNSVLAIGVVLTLAACSSSTPPTTSTAPTSDTKSTEMKPDAKPDAEKASEASKEGKMAQSGGDLKPSLVKLQSQVESATVATKAGDLTKAKAEFKTFKEGWDSVEDSLKAASKDSYKTMEREVEGLSENLLGSEKPEPSKVLPKLEFLSKTMAEYTKTLP